MRDELDVIGAGQLAERRWQWAWDSVLLAASMIAFGWVADVLIRATGAPYPIITPRLALPWVPFGIAAGVLFLRGADRWPGALVGAAIGLLVFFHQSTIFAVLQSGALVLTALGIRALLRRWRFNAAMNR